MFHESGMDDGIETVNLIFASMKNNLLTAVVVVGQVVL